MGAARLVRFWGGAQRPLVDSGEHHGGLRVVSGGRISGVDLDVAVVIAVRPVALRGFGLSSQEQ